MYEPPVRLDKVEVRILGDAVVVSGGKGRHGGGLAVPALLVPVADYLVVTLDVIIVDVSGDGLVGGDAVVERRGVISVEAEFRLPWEIRGLVATVQQDCGDPVLEEL